MPRPDDSRFMRMALEEAEAALAHDDVPIGAVAVRKGEVIASAHNQREARLDPTAHAEIVVLREAAKALGRWRLNDVTLYVTLEPCPMCAGAIVAARIKRLVYAAADLKAGAALSLYNIVQDPRLNHQTQITTDLLEEESVRLLQAFFANKRGKVEYL